MHCGVHYHLFHWFLGKCFLVEVHPYMACFCTFWQSAFSVTCFGVFFGGGNKCVGVNVCGGWCWNGTCLRMLCAVGISICTPVGIRKAFACMCMGGWYFVCSMPNYLRAQMVHSKPTSIKAVTMAAFRTS